MTGALLPAWSRPASERPGPAGNACPAPGVGTGVSGGFSMARPQDRPLAVVTGASSGIGRELAKCCARDGFDLVIAADEPAIEEAATELRGLGATVESVQADLATMEGVDRLVAALHGRPVAALLANAGRGLG